MIEPENPSFKDERSTEPYNEDKVSSPEMLERLKKEGSGIGPGFKGDWSQLERLVRNLDADKRAGDLKPGEGLKEWNEWVKSQTKQAVPRERIHLEGAFLVHVRLEGAKLDKAHLEGASLGLSHLEGAHLSGAHLNGANLQQARLEGAFLPGARLKGADLTQAHLDGAFLVGADFEGAHLRSAHLEEVDLNSAHLEGADLEGSHLERAKLENAHLEGAILREAHFYRAYLFETHFEGAFLYGAIFDGADLTAATGIRFSKNRIHRTQIDGEAKVPWSVRRRKYAGPWFFLLPLLFLIALFTPNYGNPKDPWSVLRRKYTGPWFFVHLLLLIVFFTPYAAKFLYLSGLSRAQAHIEQQADVLEQDLQGHERAEEAIREMQRRYKETHRETRAVWVLVGWTETWWAFVMVIVLVAYNAFRAVLTLRVSALRDAEERSQVTPALDAYWPLFRCHQFATILMWGAVLSVLFHTGYWAWTTKVWVAV